ncbi:MAG: hypothetical protein JXQ73_17360 [Phycisphaerae bacterium]|nr:hypothetical protein [Phycisphaerae bacterium]
MRRGDAPIILSILLLPAWLSASERLDGLGDPLPAGAVQRLGTLRMKFSAGVADYCYLPDGRAAVVTGTNVEVWDLSQGQRQDVRKVGDAGLISVMLRPDAKALLLADSRGSVIEWGLEEHRPLHRWPANQRKLNVAIYSPNAQRVLTTGSVPPTIKEWLLAEERELVSIQSGMACIRAAVYDADGKTAWVGGGYEHILERYDLTTGECLAKLWKDYCVYTMKRSADGQRLLVGSRHRCSEWRVSDATKLAEYSGHHGHAVPSIAYCRDPNDILTGSRDGSIRRWDRHQPGKYLARWWPHQGQVRELRVSPDGKWALSYGDNLLIETSVASGKARIQWDRHRGPVQAAAFLPSGRQAVSGSTDGTLRIWDVTTGKTARLIEGANLGAYAVTVAPDGQRIAVGCKDGKVREFACGDGRLLRELAGHRGWVRSVAYAPDGKRLVSSADDGSIRVWPAAGSELIARLVGHRGGVLAVAVSPDGRRAMSGGRDGTVRFWDLSAGKQICQAEAHRGWVNAVVFVGNGKRALSGGRDGRVLTWDVASGKMAGEMQHGSWVESLACSPDGARCYSGGDDGKVVAWDLGTRKRTATFAGHDGAVLALACSPDGKRVVSGSGDTTLLVWAAE